MTTSAIPQPFIESAPFLELCKALQDQAYGSNGSSDPLHVAGLVGSSVSFVIKGLFQKLARPILVVVHDKEEAAYLLNDLENLLGEGQTVFYPSSYRRPYTYEEVDNANVLLRAEVINRLNAQAAKPLVIVSYADALFEKVVTQKELHKKTLDIKVGDTLSLEFLNEVLFEYEFQRVDFVTEPGEFSVRGGIIDVFSFSNDEPVRLEFFGDEVDSIREFDVESQLSSKKIGSFRIIPNLENKGRQESREGFLKHLPEDCIGIIRDLNALLPRFDRNLELAQDAYQKLSHEVKRAQPGELYCTSNGFLTHLRSFASINYSSSARQKQQSLVAFNTLPQPLFKKKFDLFVEEMQQNHEKGIANYIFCSSETQVKRFKDIFDEFKEPVHYQALTLPLFAGFIAPDQKAACFTDHQVFERYHKFNLKNGYSKKQAINLKELNKLEVGDYVVHIDHGIGKFGGLQKIDVDGKPQEAIKLFYGDRDILYVSIHSLHKISKYNGKDGAVPKIHKLGSAAWKKVKQKTKSRVKQIAYDLIELYAKRRLKKGYAFEEDSYLQHELEASFMYEDTPDQAKATEDVKRDMESERPMDRLVCGDVGFGKTEVAIRAAFKAVDNGKQVAVLVPTTILAFQHNTTFKKRMAELPVNIDYLNRFKTGKEKKRVLEGLENGSLDIVIGTHQLVGKQVKFKDLGLLVVDEEQKFGVAVKDKLKSIKENVDVLTLTATPIPRTLQFSLMAARDLSTINTPPANRYPIESQVIGFSEAMIRDGIVYEIQRGGQVYFVHNRIQNITELAGMIQRLVPDAKVRIGHGQMEGKKLEELMMAFINGEFDVLVSTSIVESGLDVTNANTIFINNANNFGLSDLHQLRGRVGRSNKKAFCYFITPPYDMMTADARKRIKALEEHTQLGSGFNIAMKDLEIRGAGDILGGEQSGFINEIGFETYQKILSEAIEELKENEFKELYEEVEGGAKTRFVKEVQVDTDFEILFPDDYINNVRERLSLYTEMNKLTDEEGLMVFEQGLVDRFGQFPHAVQDLLDMVRVKWLCARIGLERVILKKSKFLGYFVSDQESAYYQSAMFRNVLQFVQNKSNKASLKEKETKNGLRLLLTIENVTEVGDVLKLLGVLDREHEKSVSQ